MCICEILHSEFVTQAIVQFRIQHYEFAYIFWQVIILHNDTEVDASSIVSTPYIGSLWRDTLPADVLYNTTEQYAALANASIARHSLDQLTQHSLDKVGADLSDGGVYTCRVQDEILTSQQVVVTGGLQLWHPDRNCEQHLNE